MEPIDPDIPDRFEVREELYRSDQNVRLRAFDTDLEQEVVLEYSGAGARQLAPSASERRNALRQARMRAKVRHDKIQPLKEIVETPQAIVHVLEPQAGDTLENLLLGCGTLTPDEAIDLGVGLADALQALHAEGVVHRAVAADNILMIGTGEMSALTGFAFAKPIEGLGQSSLQYNPSRKETPAARALPHHPAPEQVAGQAADARSDIFAVGCVLYRCLTARQAFEDHAAPWVEPTNPHQLVPGITKDLAAVIMKCLRQSPMSRIPTMLQLKEELLAAKKKSGGRATKPAIPLWLGAIAAGLLVTGSAWIAVATFGESGTSARSNTSGNGSNAGPIVARYEPKYNKSYAILIGNDYKDNDEIPDLDKPVVEVEALAADLRVLGFDAKVLRGSSATRQGIEDELDALEAVLQPDDQVLLYFAGHGELHANSTPDDPSGYLLPSDAGRRPENVGKGKNWLHIGQVVKKFREYKAKHILVALDCCHSGFAIPKMRGTGISRTAQDTIAGYKMAHLTRRAHVLMTSCTATQKAADNSAFAKGFREMIQKAISEKKPVTHMRIASHIEELCASSHLGQIPRMQKVPGTEGSFVFLPPADK